MKLINIDDKEKLETFIKSFNSKMFPYFYKMESNESFSRITFRSFKL
jgi:hypothetical protein